MVVTDTIPWGNVLRHHRRKLGTLLVLSVTATLLERFADLAIPLLATPFAVVGGALAILLAFRNGAAYDRWWEGRKLWGGLVNVSRTLARQAATYLPSADDRRRLVRMVIAFAHGLRASLRGTSPSDDFARLLDPELARELAGARGPVTRLGVAIGAEVGELHRRGVLDGHAAARFDVSLTELVACQGGIERIHRTPMPTAYRFFTGRFIHAYVMALPFGLVEHLGALTILVCMAVGFVFMVLPTNGELIEMPFGSGPNGLPLDAITRGIEVQLLESLGETELPPDWAPKDGVLT